MYEHNEYAKREDIGGFNEYAKREDIGGFNGEKTVQVEQVDGELWSNL